MTTKQTAFLNAMLTEPTVTKAIKKAGISRDTAYKYMKKDEFRKELDRRREECISDTVRYLQGRFSLCCERLNEIIEDRRVSPQITINAINTVFAVGRGMMEESEILAIVNELKLELLDKGGDQ